jgi:hypothetical protein
MNILKDKEILQHLRENFKDDISSSSHWILQHNSMSLSNGEDGFENSRGHYGFEGFTPRKFLRAPFHSIFQHRYIAMGKKFPLFSQFLRHGREIVDSWHGQFDLGMIRQIHTLAMVDSMKLLNNEKFFLVIGDGFGALTSLLLTSVPNSRVILVNLSKTLIADVTYISRALPNTRIALATEPDHVQRISKDDSVRVMVIKADDCELISHASIGTAFNIASMQEMNKPIIEKYFSLMRNTKQQITFYCCNRLEKKLPDGATIRFMDYPWHDSDHIHCDELCPWHQTYYNFRPPFYHSYDGQIWHRLITMNSL